MNRPASGSQKERNIRSRIHSILRNSDILRASILTLQTRCGKPTCRCAKGQKHRATVIEQSRKGKTRMRTIRPGQRREIEQWIQNWREIKALLEELSEIQWKKLEDKKGT